jgi:regulator of sigma E protease
LALGDQKISYYHEFEKALRLYANKSIPMVVQRGQVTDTLSITPNASGKIGVAPMFPDLPSIHEDYSFGEAISVGTGRAFGVVIDNAKALGKIAKGEVSASKSVSGPIGIAKMFGGSWVTFWTLVGMLSMVLAFMNLLPIPVLDGGHVLFLLYEMVRGKALPLKVQEVAMTIGTYMVLALMFYAIGNDLF